MLDLLYPRRCPVCDRAAPFGTLICPACALVPVRMNGPLCHCCGGRLREPEALFCPVCAGRRHAYRRGAAVFDYRSISGPLLRFKYGNRPEYADYFSEELAAALDRALRKDFRVPADMLVPVPLHRERLLARGYNQAELLARGTERRLGIPCRGDVLIRTENTAPLKTMSAPERRSCLKSAFHSCSDDVKSKTIILIDDIYTTGSTMDACAEALYRGGAGSVYFMALAIGAQAGQNA